MPDSGVNLLSFVEQSPIVSIDPSRPVVPRPLINDILRTRFCAPGSVFLVEAIESHVPISSKYRTVRLLLGDGHLCIQALLSGEAHGFVDGGEVYKGCYVTLGQFEARWAKTRGDLEDWEDNEQGNLSVAQERKRQDEDMVYLLVRELSTVGWNSAYVEMLKAHPAKEVSELADNGRKDKVVPGDGQVDDNECVEECTGELVQEQVPLKPALATPVHNTNQDVDDEDGYEEMVVDNIRATQRRQVRFDPSAKPQASLPWISDGDHTKPLKLTSLRSIPNLPYKQNWSVNILAVVASLSEVEPSHLPPYHQRTARLADPTTAKRVLLTVFLDPDDFAPDVGHVVLLLGVKNHRFDGGSLKKYASDRPKKGSDGQKGRWWFINPEDLKWCDVYSLREWWDGTQDLHGR